MLQLLRHKMIPLLAPRASSIPGLHTAGVFRAFLTHTRAVAERQRQVVSVLTFALGDSRKSLKTATQLAQICGKRLRATDVAGWMDDTTVGVLLPFTVPQDAVKVANSICQKMREKHKVTLEYRVYGHSHSAQTDHGVALTADSHNQAVSDAAFAGHLLALPVKTAADRHTAAHTLPLEDLCVRPMPRWKRICDLHLALLGLALFGLPMLLIAIYVKAVSPGPALFRQERVGFMGRRFRLFKLRTMHVAVDTNVHQSHLAQLMTSDASMQKLDARDTRVICGGKLLRASGLDELPQLFNILRGDMSFIGPRPCLPYEYEKYHAWYKNRCDVYPGLTGLWQVNGKNKTTFREMMRLDVAYVRQHCLWMDLVILLRTIPSIAIQMWETSAMPRKAT